jgi:thiamine biosynthesis lipoprotein
MQLAMGTFATVRAIGPREVTNDAAIAAALKLIAELDRSLHPQRFGSDIAAINSATLGARVPIGKATSRLLELTAEVFEASQGIFDPCLPIDEGRFSSLEIVGSHVIVHQRISLDLGGIAKGFGVDEALAVLKLHECQSGSVNIGGEVAAFGEPEVIAVRGIDGSLQPFDLVEEAIAITDANSSTRPSEHRGYYRRDDQRPRVRDFAVIVAPSAAIADALTKCALYCTDDELASLLARFRARII